MIQGNFIVVPLAADGKIAIGQPTVGVRVRMLGTELSHTLMDKTGSTPFWELKDRAMKMVQKDFDLHEMVKEAKESYRACAAVDRVMSLTHLTRAAEPVVMTRCVPSGS